MENLQHLVTGGQHIAGMEGEYLFPLIPNKTPVKYFTHGVDSLSGQSVFFYLNNPFIEDTADTGVFNSGQSPDETILRGLMIDNYPGLRGFIKRRVLRRLDVFSRYFNIDESVIAELSDTLSDRSVATNIDLINQVQKGNIEVGCLSEYHPDFFELNGQLGNKDDWWYVAEQDGRWYRSRKMQPHRFVFPTAKPMFIGLLMISEGLLTPHYPWYYEEQFVDELQSLDLLRKRFFVRFKSSVKKISNLVVGDDFLPAWVPRPVRLGDLLWLSTCMEREFYGLDDFVSFGKGAVLSSKPLAARYLPDGVSDKEARKFLKDQGGWLKFLGNIIEKNSLFSKLSISDKFEKINQAKIVLANFPNKSDVFPALGLSEKSMTAVVEQLVSEISMVAQIAKTVKNCWSFPEWKLLGVDPREIASYMEIVNVLDLNL